MIHAGRQGRAEISWGDLELDRTRDIARARVGGALSEAAGQILGDQFFGFQAHILGREGEAVEGRGIGNRGACRGLPGNAELNLCTV